jgi:hypothetical protein
MRPAREKCVSLLREGRTPAWAAAARPGKAAMTVTSADGHQMTEPAIRFPRL